MGARDERAHVGGAAGRATAPRSRIGSRSRPTGRWRRPTSRPAPTSTTGARARSAPRSPTTGSRRRARASRAGRSRPTPPTRSPASSRRCAITATGRGARPAIADRASARPTRTRPVVPRRRRSPRHGVHAPPRRPGHDRVVRRRPARRRAAARVGVPRQSVRERVRPVLPAGGARRCSATRRSGSGSRACATASRAIRTRSAAVRRTLAPVEHELWAEADAAAPPAPTRPTRVRDPSATRRVDAALDAPRRLSRAREPVRRPTRSTTTVRPELRAVPEGWTWSSTSPTCGNASPTRCPITRRSCAATGA